MSVTADASGALTAQQTYFPFGTVRTTEGALPTDYTFTGQKLDASSNLMYYGARYYDAVLGRFAQPDSIIPDLYNPQSLNRYSYVNNNPVNRTDPSGHGWAEDLWKWVQQLIRTVTNPRGATTNACALTLDVNCGRITASPSLSGVLEAGNKYALEKNKVNFGPPIINPETVKAIERVAQLGQWLPKNEYMSPESRAYQEYVTGRSGEVFMLNDVKFDGFNGNTLLDAKNHYEQFIDPDTGNWVWWFDNSGGKGMIRDARRQVEAAQGAPIEWHFAERGPAELLKKLLQDEGIEGIEVIYDPLPVDDDV